MPDDLSDVRGDIEAESDHRRLRPLPGASGSPKTSSNDSPFLPAA
jgi:hypothetical protein